MSNRTKTAFDELRREVKSNLPERFNNNEGTMVEDYHYNFTTKSKDESVNVMWLENNMGQWFEVDLYDEDGLIDSVAFDERDAMLQFISEVDSEF